MSTERAPLSSNDNTSAVKSQESIPAFLSPVSKLELARKYAADEQQKRIEAANERLVNQLKQRSIKRKKTETQLEEHIQKKMKKIVTTERLHTSYLSEETTNDADSEAESGPNSMRVISQIQSTVVSNEKPVLSVDGGQVSMDSDQQRLPEPVDLRNVSDISSLETVEDEGITRTLLREARKKLDRIAANSVSNHSSPTSFQSPSKAAMLEDFEKSHSHSDPSQKKAGTELHRPLTNYHLKQMGYADNVNIYAPMHEQQSQLKEFEAKQTRVERDWNIHKKIEFQSPNPNEDSEYDDEDFLSYEADDMEAYTKISKNEIRGSNAHMQTQRYLPQHSEPLQRTEQLKRRKNTRSSSLWYVPLYMISLFLMILAIMLATDVFEEYHNNFWSLILQYV
ncbi:unnamed protein product [Albugo candida]|uniref:Uncharacterized protein n=1 Tax=Albugo candida TaxID=65357 RepID=A0A024G5U3_9STRA|nr:unnamed protein product [Albugo candida]|eukprot:CCI41690.1 unnamed protein product [Albugo candida]